MFFAAKAFAAGIFLAVIESVFFGAVEIAGVRPDLMVIALIVMSARTNFGKFLLLAFLLGLTRDFYSASPVGMHALALTLTAFLLLAQEEYVLVENWVGQGALAFTGAVIYGTCIFLLKPPLQYEMEPLWVFLKTAVAASIYTAVVTPAFCFLLRKPQALPYLRLKLQHIAEHETIPENKT